MEEAPAPALGSKSGELRRPERTIPCQADLAHGDQRRAIGRKPDLDRARVPASPEIHEDRDLISGTRAHPAMLTLPLWPELCHQ